MTTQPTHFSSITVGMLAQAKVPDYVEKIQGKTQAIQLSLKQEGSHCTCNSLVLSLLAVLAAAGAAVLIVFSGGPSTLQLFVPGVAFGAISLGLTLWIIAIVCRSIKHRREQNAELADETNAGVTYADLLKAMQKSSPEQIQNTMQKFEPNTNKRQEFMRLVQDAYFPKDNAQPLTEEKKKVLAAFAQFPKDLYIMQKTNTVNRPFALEILRSIDPKLILDTKKSEKVLFSKLFTAAGVPNNPEEATILARHPLAVALIAQTNSEAFTPKIVADIYAKMDEEQKTEFLKQLGTDFDILKTYMTREKNPRDMSPEKKIITNIVEQCVSNTLTQAFAAKFAVQEVAKETKELLEQIAKWPEIAAERITLDDHGLINALEKAMNEDQQKEFIKTISNTFSLSMASAESIRSIIENYAQKNIALPDLIKRALAQQQQLMAHVAKDLKGDKAQSEAHEIFLLMSVEDRIEFLEVERGINLNGLKTRITRMLKKAVKDPDLLSSHIIGYFKKHTDDFQAYVLKNAEVGSEKERNFIALRLLEDMGEAAEIVIQDLDKELSTKGFPNFNILVNMLIDEVKGQDLSQKPVARTRAILIAQFKYAPSTKAKYKTKIEQSNATVVFDGNKKLNENPKDWDNFNAVAASQKENVWKKKA